VSTIHLSERHGLVDAVGVKGGDDAWRRVRSVRWPMFNDMDVRELENGLDCVAGRAVYPSGTEVVLPDGKTFGHFVGATFRRC
jgi:hypothetical protein